MPELPEVEVVRRGLAGHVLGRCFVDVEIRHPRAMRHYPSSPAQFQAHLEQHRIHRVRRRGKFLWLELGHHREGEPAVVVHLGMSGQMLLKPADVDDTDPNFRHLRIRSRLDDGQQLWFVDQRTFGYWLPTHLGEYGRGIVPDTIAHIARDLLDPECDFDACAALFATKNSEIKKLLLNQEIVSGIGNIYADEMLWAARIHPRQPASSIRRHALVSLLHTGRQIMTSALEHGGTSFDELYVNVNGQSGYFDVSLEAYGRHGRACSRCGTIVVREKFANRSSHVCPHCQQLTAGIAG